MPDIKFHFLKSPDFREVPVHGAFGGLSPNGGGLFLAVYSERSPLPKVAVHELTDEGLSQEKTDQREGLDGVVRTLQFGMHMTIEQAGAIRDWLNEKIEEYEQITKGRSNDGA